MIGQKLLNKLLIAPVDQEPVDFDAYMRLIASGRLKDKVMFGVSENERGFYKLDPVDQPGALFIGGTGSGKSVALRFTMATRMASNSEHDFFIFFDALKSAADYKFLFEYKDNVAKALNSPAKIVPVIKMVYAECMARRQAFHKAGAGNIYKYEQIMRKEDPSYKLARIFLVIEEFHSVPNSTYVNFSMKSDTPGSVANQFKELMRIARSFGIFLMAATQRATPEDVPSAIKPGLTTLLAFRVNNINDASYANLPHAADIPSTLRGRCAYEGGFMQFPYLKENPEVPYDMGAYVVKQFYKPFTAKMIKYQVSDFHTALEGEGNEGMVRVYPFKDVLVNISEYAGVDVFTKFLVAFDFKVEKQTNTALYVQMIAERDGEKYAVLAITNSNQISTKNLAAFIDGAIYLGCDKVILLSSDESAERAKERIKTLGKVDLAGSYFVERDDLMKIAETLDNKDIQEPKVFEELFTKLALVRKLKVEKNKELESPSDDLDGDDDDDLSIEEMTRKLRGF